MDNMPINSENKKDSKTKLKTVWSFINIIKWGGLLLALLIFKDTYYGVKKEYLELEILTMAATIAIVMLLANFVVSTIGTSADAGNSFAKKFITRRFRENRTFCNGYVAFSLSIVFMSFCSGTTTYYGISNFLVNGNGGMLITFIVPLVLAFSSALITYAFWCRILFIISNDSIVKSKKIRALTLYTLIGGVIIFCISTTTSVLGLGGKQAIKQHYLIALTEFKDSLSAVSQYRTEEAKYVPLLKSHYQKYVSLNQDELSGNGITGTKGEGAVANFLKTSSIEFAQALKILEESQKNLADYHTELNNQLNLISDSLIKDDREVSEIEKYAEQNLEQIKQGLVSLKNENQVLILKSLANYLSYNKQDLLVLSGNSNIAEKQNLALTYYSRLISSTSDELKNAINDLNSRTEPKIPKFKRINARDAIFTYWKDILSIWIFCIVVDFWIIVWLCMFFDFGRRYIMFDNDEQYKSWMEKALKHKQ